MIEKTNLLVYLYLVFSTFSWKNFFNQKFYLSLAPSVISTIIIMICSGMLFGSVTLGIYLSVALFIIMFLYSLIKTDNKKQNIISKLKECLNEGLLLFSILFVFVCFINYKKTFIYWDEFAHWGKFVKEVLRLDKLYCFSPLNFSHKDYVPAITMFEVLWSKLNGVYHEADIYRSIQMLMFIFILPIFSPFYDDKKEIKRLLPIAVLIVMLIPFVFNISEAFEFYHSIYTDMIAGIIIFYCFHEATYYNYSTPYHIFAMILNLSVLVMSRMTGIVFYPMLLVVFIVYIVFVKKIDKKYYKYLLLLIAPLLLWLIYNRYVNTYGIINGFRQTYNSVDVFGSLYRVFLEDTDIPSYWSYAKRHFITSLFTRDVLLKGSYVTAILFVVVVLISVSLYQNRVNRTMTLLTSLYIVLSSVFYAFLMYYLYLTQFSEYEATILTSYERYMNMYVISALLIFVSTLYNSLTSKNERMMISISIIMLFYLLSNHIYNFKQLLPGNISKDYERYSIEKSISRSINDNVPYESSVLIVDRYDVSWRSIIVSYYCIPNRIDANNFGPPSNENDILAAELSNEDFLKKISEYDYLCLYDIDDLFLDTYSKLFEEEISLQDYSIYKIENVTNDMIDLTFVLSLSE